MINSDNCVSNWEVHLTGNPIVKNIGDDYVIYDPNLLPSSFTLLLDIYIVAAFWIKQSVPAVLHNVIEMSVFSSELCSLERVQSFYNDAKFDGVAFF